MGFIFREALRVSGDHNTIIMRRDPKNDLLTTVFALVDGVVEIYLGSVVRPFVKVHEKFYSGLNVVLRKILDDNQRFIPEWFTANFITYFRTALVVPTVLLLAWNYCVSAAVICIAVDFGDFLDGVVARFWVDIKKSRAKEAEGKDKGSSSSPANSDDDSFGEFTEANSLSSCFARGDVRPSQSGILQFVRGCDHGIPAFCTVLG